MWQVLVLMMGWRRAIAAGRGRRAKDRIHVDVGIVELTLEGRGRSGASGHGQVVIALEMVDELAVEAGRRDRRQRLLVDQRLLLLLLMVVVMVMVRLLVDQRGTAGRAEDHRRRLVRQQHPGCQPGTAGDARRVADAATAAVVGAIHDHHVVCSIGQIFHKTLLL